MNTTTTIIMDDTSPLNLYNFIMKFLLTCLIMLPTLLGMSSLDILTAIMSPFNRKPADESKTTLDESKTTPDESKTTPEESKTTPDESKTAPDESKTAPDESLDNITTIYHLGREPVIGDIIRFSTRTNTPEDNIRDECNNIHCAVQRCISTYGQIEIKPDPGFISNRDEVYEGGLYIVVGKDNQLPNAKGRAFDAAIRGDMSLINTQCTHLHVSPLGGLSIRESIYWYINWSDLTIRQHEDGTVSELIDNVKIVGHDDYMRRSNAPSPEPEEDSDPGEIDYNEDEDPDEYNPYDCNDPYEFNEEAYMMSMRYSGDMNFNDGDY
jgi:hypothetical protein